jgi:hypothetical protein
MKERFQHMEGELHELLIVVATPLIILEYAALKQARAIDAMVHTAHLFEMFVQYAKEKIPQDA